MKPDRPRQIHCLNCGGEIVRADDGSRWLHVVGYGWQVSCGLVATPPIHLQERSA